MERSYVKRGLSLLMCFVMLCGLITTGMFATRAEAEEAVTNPTAVIDIVVNVPADYPGTFLDFKDELTDKLIAQGMDPAKFRIISSAIKIDTTDTKGWNIYDHYNSQSDYNRLHLDSQKQPFRQADNSYASGSNPTTIERVCKFSPHHLPLFRAPHIILHGCCRQGKDGICRLRRTASSGLYDLSCSK